MHKAGVLRSPAYLSYQFFRSYWHCIDWLLPPECGGCQKKGNRWCQECQEKVETIGSRVCQICGEPQPEVRICGKCHQIHPVYNALRSWAAFNGPIREALHRLKYRRDIGLGECLSRSLIEYFTALGWDIDLVVPVPLSHTRLIRRGYNQAALLARPLALASGVKYSSQALLRIKDAPSQVGLSVAQRKHNVADAFWADQSRIKGRNVLVIDDVTTTGATLKSCAKSMLRSGAKCVYALTLARAVLAGNRSDR